MTPEIKAAEDRAYESLAPGELMQRAARGLADVVRQELDRLSERSMLVAAGPGNNGGDGLYAGAFLAAEGVTVRAWRTASRVHEQGWAALIAAGGTEIDAAPALRELGETPVVVDAVYGMGARPGLPEDVARFAAACRRQGIRVISCDVPSGVDSDSHGTEDLPSFHADLTVAMGAWKPAHVLQPNRSRCGELRLVDIGLDLPRPGLVKWERTDVAAVWPYPDATSDKDSRGVVGLDTGSDAYPGAGLLSAYGAVYAGAGMVRLLGSERVKDLVVPALPNVVTADDRVQAWVIGSGWGSRPDAAGRLAEVLSTGLPVVVDADALGFLPRSTDREDVLATPHPGELARMLDADRTAVTADPLGAVREAAEAYGVTVLLKGASQYVASPSDPQIVLAVPGPAWTAQAGSGDVLAGICGTLLAAGLPARDAAVASASIQAIAAADHPGPYPPQDIARFLPSTIAGLQMESLRRP